MEKYFEINGHKVIINKPQSKIGYTYPRLFIQESAENYVNLDLTIGHAFRMKKKDFEDWLEDAIKIEDEDEIKNELSGLVDYKALKNLLSE